MIRSPRVRQPLAALSLGLTVGGCTSWRVEPGNRSQAIAQSARHAIRVQMRDGEVLVIDDPKVVGDSIRGGAMRYAPGEPSVAVALSDVQRVETTQFHAGKTFLMLGIVLPIAGSFAAQWR